ncbi:kinase-like domain-containing protein [Aspergillus multicolor]|uniref:kinase-like domain-containing protein n=1 Tax=Aspergillus multicolor TaxID=41759 RepID=UPI003CCDBA9B
MRLSVPRLSALFRRKPFPLPSPGPRLPADIPIDEEISPVYNSRHFYPARPGEVLGGRYQTLVKVGWGVSSTVWLARDLQWYQMVVALKITNNNASFADHEREDEHHISKVNPSHRGRSVIRTFLDSFHIQGPELPLPLAKTYIRALLTGLNYVHKDFRTVHTDLKLENITVSFEDPSVLGDFIDSQLESPIAFKTDSSGRHVYQCHNDFGPLRGLRSIPQLVDFGVATTLPEDDDWGMWDIIEGRELSQHIYDRQGRYDAKLHIAEMIALLGYIWPGPVRREDNKICETAEEYFGGPFFDKNGQFLYEDLIPDRRLEDTISSLEGDDKEAFLDLAKGMLDWHMGTRKPAAELATHPFLQPKPKQ